MHVTLSESTQPEPSVEGTVIVDTTLSQSSSFVSENFSDDSQNHFYRRQNCDTDTPSYFDAHRTAMATAVQLNGIEETIGNNDNVASCSDSETESTDGLEEFEWIACTSNVNKMDDMPLALSYAVNIKDPSVEEIGDPTNLNNYLPDSGATQHMTPRKENLFDAVEGQNLGVEVADGHIIRCSTTGKVIISMTNDTWMHVCTRVKQALIFHNQVCYQ
jgi:hypothetical protein